MYSGGNFILKKYISRNRCLKVEFFRSFFNWRFLAGIIGVLATFILGAYCQNSIFFNSLDAIEDGIYGMTGLVVLMICSYDYAGSFCEDMEHGYLIVECMRSDIKYFVKCRLTMIFLSSMSIMTLGMTGYAIYVRLRYGLWFSIDSTPYSILKGMGNWYISILENYPIYFFMLIGCLYGMLAGILSLLAALFSLFTPNKLLVGTIPFLAMYLLLDLSAVTSLWEGRLNVWIIFQPFVGAMKRDIYNFVYAVLYTMSMSWGLYLIIVQRIERIVHG